MRGDETVLPSEIRATFLISDGTSNNYYCGGIILRMANKSNSKKRPLTVDDIINEIKEKSTDGDYIYRGERKKHNDVSSGLYRDCDQIDIESFDIRYAQREILKVAKEHIGEPPPGIFEAYKGVSPVRNRYIEHPNRRTILEADEIEILTELQHYGAKTNLIDFTTDYLIAIFFACSGEPKVPGRVIVLKKTENIEDMIIRPYNPRNRVIAQKSVFLYPPEGFIDVPDDKKVTIPFALKQRLLTYLRQHHDISAETIYNDIHGFIRNQNIHKIAYIEFSMGFTFHSKGENAVTNEKKLKEYEKAIKHYDTALDLNPEISVAYENRAECWLHFREWDMARKDFKIASDMGLGLVDGFRNTYENVAAFENKMGFKMPEDLAKMLGG